LVVAVVLVLLRLLRILRILIKHLASTMHRVRNTINLMLFLLPPQTIIITGLLGSLGLIMTGNSTHGLRLGLSVHFVTDHALSAIYQFSFPLLSRLVYGSLSECGGCWCHLGS
jgi:hypothetical protein